MSESAETGGPARAHPERFGIAADRLIHTPWLLPAAAVFAGVCLVLAAVGFGGMALSARGTSSGFSSTVIPSRPDVQTSTTTDSTRAAAASGAAAPAALQAGAAQSPALPGFFVTAA